MGIKLFAMNISARLNDRIDEQLKWFSLERQKKILSYRFNADKNRTVWAEMLARYVVAKKFSCSLEKVQIYRSALGKPHIVGQEIEISLSHAGNWVVCSVGMSKSGVDVEVDSTDALEIAENFFLQSEYEKIISLPENLRGRQFLMYWTLKESYFKLTGSKNYLRVDCEKILSGTSEVSGKNYFLKDGAVIGVCKFSS